MITRTYTFRFNTPAFLGNAEQNGQWRTPPFKAQLRQWWRVAYAAAHKFNVNVAAMREREGFLFGNAWLSHQENGRTVNDHCKSQVRVRLDRWDLGQETKRSWGQQELDKSKEGVVHPSVGTIGPKLYLGYGPLVVEKVRSGSKTRYATVLKQNAAIQADEAAGFSLAFPEDNSLIEHALWLMHRYGTVGGRSRNGWGSYELAPQGETPELQGTVPLRPWRECLELDWPHAIGQDQRGALIWQTTEHDDWQSLMRTLAIIKIGLRTQFKFHLNPAAGDRQILRNGQPQGIEHGQAQKRHWLSYPVTNHPVQSWESEYVNGERRKLNLRLPNSLRFKVRQTASGKLVGVIFHMPCLPPAAFNATPHRAAIEQTWKKVHDLLDELVKAPASRTYTMIDDQTRLAALAPQLNTVAPLKRIPE